MLESRTLLFLIIAHLSLGASVLGQQPPDEEDVLTDVIVVTASRTEQPLDEVPAAMTVLSAEQLETMPADDYGDLLRNVPGLNVSQMSARDIQISGRQATSSLANSELVLIDGRTLYLDFFGFVMWDLLPINVREVKQIEVVRGPGSAVWGANALSGVINVITKTPAEMAGTSLMLGGGDLGTAYANLTHAGSGGSVGYKLSGSYYEQDPYDRPTGIIPGTTTPYPVFENEGTEQPKVDLRLDVSSSDGNARLVLAGGYAGTDGIVHSGIGPFDIESGSSLGHGKAEYTLGNFRASIYANLLDGEAGNLLTRGIGGQPILLGFESETVNLDLGNTSFIGETQILSYGANVRRSEFDLTIAPAGDDRDEWGIFIQDEIFFSDKVRWVIGGRYDDIDPIDPVFSPRTSLLISSSPAHTFRLSYNEAFRAPSLVENFLDITIVNGITLPPAPPLGIFQPIPYSFRTAALGNPLLTEEGLTAFEIGYIGYFRPDTTVTVSVYRNELEKATDFFPATFYSGANPPEGWPLPAFLLDFPPLLGALPSSFSYRNIGEVINEGVEISLDMRPSTDWSWFVNYSYQAEPDVTGIPASEVNIPPENRFNLGITYSGQRFFASANGNWVDEAFWTDVLDARFHGPTDSYAQVNLAAGVRLSGDRVTLSVTAQNIFDEDVQQHVFGDIIGRKVSGQIAFDF